MHRTQCFFNISFVSRRKILVLFAVECPEARWCARARMKISLSGRSKRIKAAKMERPAEVQKRDRQDTDVSGTRVRLTTAARRYPTAYPCWRTPLARPRTSTGRFSSAVDAANPQIPPMPIPNSERTARNCWNVCTKPEPSSRIATMIRLMTNGHLRP